MTGSQEPQDVESRLRASLRAYAEVVDAEPTGQSPVAGGGSRSAPSRVRGWRAAALVAAAVTAVAGGAWLVTGNPADPSTTAAQGSTTVDTGAEAAAAQPPAQDEAAGARSSEEELAAASVGPAGQLVVPSPAEVGVAYPFDLYTHCGIVGADVAGVWFAADPPLVEEFSPPDGWADPYQRGTLTLESADAAVFRDDLGHEISLRSAESERPPPCA